MNVVSGQLEILRFHTAVDEFQNQFEKDVTLSVRDNTDRMFFLSLIYLMSSYFLKKVSG